MENYGPYTCIFLSVEIELPGGLPEALQDVIVNDLTDELNIEELTRRIKKWAHTVSGENCRVSIDGE